MTVAKARLWDATQQFILETSELLDRVKLLVIVGNTGRLRVLSPWFHETPAVATRAPSLRRSILSLRELVQQMPNSQLKTKCRNRYIHNREYFTTLLPNELPSNNGITFALEAADLAPTVEAAAEERC